MNDSNLGIVQPSKPSANQNYIRLCQCNGDVLSDRRELVGGSFTSVEFLFSACEDGGSTKFKKYNSNKCTLANSFFKTADKIVSRNSSNIIYVITCLNCFIQYVGETAQQLNIRFTTHRSSMSGKIKSNSCKW